MVIKCLLIQNHKNKKSIKMMGSFSHFSGLHQSFGSLLKPENLCVERRKRKSEKEREGLHQYQIRAASSP